MSATPGATNEYSRGSGDSGRDSGGNSGGNFGRFGPPGGHRTDELDRGSGGLILAGSLLAALLLIVAEFTSLYDVHIATSSIPIKTVSGGANHSYAMLIIGLAAAGLGIGVWRSGSRPALLALGVLGVVALLIALLGDLPDSHATGLAGSAARGYINASSTPSAGLYMETLGAVLLIATCGLGFMMLGAPVPGWGSGRGPRPARPERGRPAGGPKADEPEPGNGRSGNGASGNGGRGAPRTHSRRRRSGEEPGAR